MLYKIQTASGSTEMINADRAEREENRVSFFRGDDEVASFVGASSYNVVEEVSLPTPDAPQ